MDKDAPQETRSRKRRASSEKQWCSRLRRHPSRYEPYIYNKRFLAGILWLIITPGLWIGTGGLLGWVCHVISAYTAYTYARDHSERPWKRQGA